MSQMIDWDMQLFIDSFLCLLAFGILLVIISIPILVIIFLVKAIKNQNRQAEIYKNTQERSR